MADTTTTQGGKHINITTSDGVSMNVPRPVAERSILIKNLLEDLGGESEESIPIPNVCIYSLITSFWRIIAKKVTGERGRNEESSGVVRPPPQ